MCGGGSNHMPRIMEPFSFEDVCEAGPGAGAYGLLGALKTRLFDEKRFHEIKFEVFPHNHMHAITLIIAGVS